MQTSIAAIYIYIYIYSWSKEMSRKTSTLIATSARRSLTFSGVYSTSAKAPWNCNRWKEADSIKCCQHLTVQPQRRGSAGLIETVWCGEVAKRGKMLLAVCCGSRKCGCNGVDAVVKSYWRLKGSDDGEWCKVHLYEYKRDGNSQRKNLYSIMWRQSAK